MESKMSPDSGFEAVYEEYYGKIYNYVYRILLHRENAEDVVSETFLKAMVAWNERAPEIDSLSAWLYSIARHCALNFIRSASFRSSVSLESMREDVTLPEPFENPWQAGSAEECAWEILSRLSVEERDFLCLRYEIGLSAREVAQILGISEAATAKRYSRLLAKCQKIAENLE